jgi:transcriptional/translational regulatory protein YebC/TACO1
MASARRSGLSKSTVKAAIDRGQGISPSGAQLVPLTIEFMLPPQVAAMVECLTAQKNRTMMAIQEVLKDHGATMTPTSYMFERKGKIAFESVPAGRYDKVLEEAIELGALDVDSESSAAGERFLVYTRPDEMASIGEKLCRQLDLKMESQALIWDPNSDNKVSIKGEVFEHIKSLKDELEEEESVQAISWNTDKFSSRNIFED